MNSENEKEKESYGVKGRRRRKVKSALRRSSIDPHKAVPGIFSLSPFPPLQRKGEERGELPYRPLRMQPSSDFSLKSRERGEGNRGTKEGRETKKRWREEQERQRGKGRGREGGREEGMDGWMEGGKWFWGKRPSYT